MEGKCLPWCRVLWAVLALSAVPTQVPLTTSIIKSPLQVPMCVVATPLHRTTLLPTHRQGSLGQEQHSSLLEPHQRKCYDGLVVDHKKGEASKFIPACGQTGHH